MSSLCIKCKGRGFCGQPCKILKQVKLSAQKVENVKENFFGSSPGIFVGHFGYPKINMGFLAPPELDKESWKLDKPEFWYKQKYNINSVLNTRYQLVNSKSSGYIDPEKNNSKILSSLQEIAMAKKPVDIEVNLSKKPNVIVSLSRFSAPIGSSASLKKINITENAKISQKVEQIINDDLKSDEQIIELYKNCDINQIQKIVSSGLLGQKKKMVPTRWSITATDDTIALNLINKIKNYKTIDKMTVFDNKYLGNHFVVILLPSIWSFEMMEFWKPGSNWNKSNAISIAHDREGFNGRKKYAKEIAGGYYATRIAVLEYLEKIKKQATVIVVRKISDEYFIPLGVWVVRETVRNCFNRSVEFSDKKKLVEYTERLLDLKWKEKSTLLNTQKRLNDWLI